MSTVEQPRAVLRSASDHRTDATSWVDDACAIDSRATGLPSRSLRTTAPALRSATRSPCASAMIVLGPSPVRAPTMPPF